LEASLQEIHQLLGLLAWLHSKFLNKIVIALTTSIEASYFYHVKKREGVNKLDDGDREAISKLHMVEKWYQSFSSSHLKGKSLWN